MRRYILTGLIILTACGLEVDDPWPFDHWDAAEAVLREAMVSFPDCIQDRSVELRIVHRYAPAKTKTTLYSPSSNQLARWRKSGLAIPTTGSETVQVTLTVNWYMHITRAYVDSSSRDSFGAYDVRRDATETFIVTPYRFRGCELGYL